MIYSINLTHNKQLHEIARPHSHIPPQIISAKYQSRNVRKIALA